MVKKIKTQGDRAILANIARNRFSIDGKGLKIGIISDSFNALGGAKKDIRKGELPGGTNPDGFTRPVRVLRDFPQGSDEGRALAQILFDVAPGSELLFHTVGEDEQDFASAIQALTNAGADVIIDDILLATSPFFQDGVAAQAVDRAVNQGVVYVTAAGNNGNRAYSSSFRSGASFTFRGTTYEAHDFDAGEGVDLFQAIQIPANAEIDLLLNWDEAAGAVNTDLDVFLLDRPMLPGAGGEVLDDGTLLIQNEDSPAKRVQYDATDSKTVYLLIAHNTASTGAAPNQIQWISFANTIDGNTIYEYVNDTPGATGASTVFGHQNAAGAIAVGAVAYKQTPKFGSKSPKLESFSSRVGVPILFDVQGNRLTTPEIRSKPEIIAPDRIATGVPGFRSFLGTSAAAPHVAAVVALMLQRAGGRRSLTPAQVLTALQSQTVPIESDAPGLKLGLIQADAAVLQASLAQVIGTSAADSLVGGGAAENLWGWEGDDRLTGGGGMDALLCSDGNDRGWGDQGNDYILGQAGKDVLVGGQGNDCLVGGEGRDTLQGGNGDDQLWGGTESDRLDGGKGDDYLSGGAGRDTFVLTRQGCARILDFEDRRDRLQLPQGVKFGAIDIRQAGQDTLIQFQGKDLARLKGVNPDLITLADFGG